MLDLQRDLCKKRLISVSVGRSKSLEIKLVFPLEYEIVDLEISRDHGEITLLIEKRGGK